MIREHFQYRTTITTILAEEEKYINAAKIAMVDARSELEHEILRDPFFGSTYDPYTTEVSSAVAQRMSAASKPAGVGPMAAVAGTIAWYGVEAMQDAGATFAVIDNGGDIALIADHEVTIGIHAGTSSFSGKLAFRIPPQETILGICTSSATVGPSVSFGTADAVTVFSRNVSLADAWATSLCNDFTECSDEFFQSRDLRGVCGICAIAGDTLCRWGTLPEIVKASVDPALITAGR
ncbi:UPF0280 family protein [Methanogenium marinum]|uniref:UPF0280 protein L0665_02270 n=1 Tax=Methanogenium marinum TaxID=348610 RepID=A0A9Q4KUE8_9EURY|nr:UPF0280 family protein [Methanogenium marinum]MDE4907446.1 UPF0280 family protein [Methanogenium marinum]